MEVKLLYRPDIDFLRGVSILSVIVFHAFPKIIPGGFVGVDVFFVISGFLITSILTSQERISLLQFYDKRIRRLAPTLLFVLCAALLISWSVFYLDELNQIGKHIWRSTSFTLNFALMAEHGYFDIESHRKPLLHLWSLSIEEQFYLIWPLVLILLNLVFKSRASAAFATVFIILLPSFYANVSLLDDENVAAFFHTLARAWQLGVGATVALLRLSVPITLRPTFAITGLLAILYACFNFDGTDSYSGYNALLPTFGAAIFIVSKPVLNWFKPVIALGRLSYPLYLWHWLILSTTFIYFAEAPSYLVIFTGLLLSLGLSILSHLTVEKLRTHPSRFTSAYLSLLLISVATTGYFFEQMSTEQRSHMSYLDDASQQLVRRDSSDDSCRLYSRGVLAEDSIFDYCRSDLTEGQSKILVIGDSHAHTLFDGVKAEASKRNMSTLVLGNSSCPPYRGFDWFDAQLSVEKCQKKIEQILRITRDDSSITKVIIATRSMVYFNGEVSPPYTQENIIKSRSNSTPTFLSSDDFHTSVIQTIEEIKYRVSPLKIFYLLENPELGFDPRNAIERPFDFLNVSASFEGVKRDHYISRMSPSRSLIRQKLEDEMATILDPVDALCEVEFCRAVLDGSLVYADDDHLSAHGSKLLLGKLASTIFE